VGQDEVGDHRSTFLGEAGLVESGDAQPVDGGGGREQGVDGDDAGAADAGGQDPVDGFECRRCPSLGLSGK